MKLQIIKKLVLISLFIVPLISFSAIADGWVNDGYGNWLYMENGEYVKATWKNIDGVNYYFDTKGYWLPTEPVVDSKLAGSEKVTFIMEGKDESDRKYKTKITLPRPIISGANADAINEFIKRDFEKVITKYYVDTRINSLFLVPEIKIVEVMEAYNVRGIIGLGYFGGGMFNLYIDTNKLEMWATRNVN